MKCSLKYSKAGRTKSARSLRSRHSSSRYVFMKKHVTKSCRTTVSTSRRQCREKKQNMMHLDTEAWCTARPTSTQGEKVVRSCGITFYFIITSSALITLRCISFVCDDNDVDLFLNVIADQVLGSFWPFKPERFFLHKFYTPGSNIYTNKSILKVCESSRIAYVFVGA